MTTVNKLACSWGTLVYEEAQGAGQATVFLHGTGCDSSDWAQTFEHVNNQMRVITMDFRGHGMSDVPHAPFILEDLADDVLALVRHLNVKRPLLVGHSLGGMVAMAVARKSANVGGLVLLEGWTALSCVAQAFDGDRMFGHLSEKDIASIRSKSVATKAKFTEGEWQFFWDTVKAFDAEEFLKHTEIPIWQVYGAMGRKDDSACHLRVPERDNIYWRWLSDAGHYLPHECPAQVAEICNQAVGSVAREIS